MFIDTELCTKKRQCVLFFKHLERDNFRIHYLNFDFWYGMYKFNFINEKTEKHYVQKWRKHRVSVNILIYMTVIQFM